MVQKEFNRNLFYRLARWSRERLFNTPGNVVISFILLGVISFVVYGFLKWAFLDAVWVGDAKDVCADAEGACWAFIVAKFRFFMFGFYPLKWVWRPIVMLILLVCATYWQFSKYNKKPITTFSILFVGLPTITFVILRGWGSFIVLPDSWGGLILTLILSSLGLLFSYPAGMILALLRTGKLKFLRIFAVIFIEFFRGIPLITILFMSSIVVPLFLPPSIVFPKIFRLVLGLTIFQSVYLAEVIRGGLQAIGKGQYDAAKSLGMTSLISNYFVILPQATRLSLANITSISIAFVKDTSLILIVGWFDLLGIVKPLSSDVNWIGMEPEGYFFVAVIFWLLCLMVSRIGITMENRLNKYMVAKH